MKRTMLFMLLITSVLLSLAANATKAAAEVNINIGINAPPPAVVIPAPPALVVIPGTYAYFAPDIDVELVFYHGYWYRPYGKRWYRAAEYNGPWVHIAPARLPYVIMHLPPDYRHIPPGHERVPYGQVKKHWKTWEAEKHWDRHEKKHEMKERHKEEKRYKEEKQERKHGKGRDRHGD